MPFPQRLQKAKREERFSKFLEIFKKIEINITFAEVINQMPNYAKILKEILKEKILAYTPTVPFPQRLQKAKREERFSKFLEIFKKIEINITFAEVINQMPNYAKFLKEILNKKRKIAEEGIVNLTATCSAVI